MIRSPKSTGPYSLTLVLTGQMLSVARLLGHFAQPAEAHKAFLITELGNLFPIEDMAGQTGNVNQPGLGSLAGSVTQALLGFMAGITTEEADFEYLTGTNSIGTLHDYSVLFAIPPNVANSSSGYVGLYNAGDPHTSVPIPNFFTTYRYSNSSNTLQDVGYGSAIQNFDSIEITAHDNSRSQSGTVDSSYGGFYAYDNGTYVVKLHPGLAYRVLNGINCFHGTCDKISVIASDSDLLATTSEGLPVKSLSGLSSNLVFNSGSYVAERDYPYCDWDDCGRAIWSARTTIEAFTNINRMQVSDTNNIVLSRSPSMLNVTNYMYCTSSGWHNANFIAKASYSRSFSGPYFTTSNDHGNTMLNKITYESHNFNIWSTFDRPRYDPGEVCHYPGTISWDDLHFTSLNGNEPYVRFNPFPLTVFDTGLPVKEHFAYWSPTVSDSMYGPADATHNPNNVIVSDNNVYMIIEKNTVGRYLDVSANNITNSALRLTNLPPNTVFSLDGSGSSSLVTGVTGNNGEITIPYSSLGFSSMSGLTLNLFHDSVVFRNFSGMNVVDHFNGGHFNITTSTHDNVVFATTKYVDLPIPLDGTEIDSIGIGLGNCDADKFALSYLDGTYNGGDNLLVPVVPGFDRVCFSVGEKQITLKFDDINHDNIGYGSTAEGASNKRGSAGSGSVSSSFAVAEIPVTTTSGGSLEFIVNGAIKADTNISYRKEYKGPLAEFPGAVEFNIFDGRVASGASGCRSGGIGAFMNSVKMDSAPPNPLVDIYMDVVVSKNNVDVLTKRIFSAYGIGATTPVKDNAPVSEEEHLLISLWDGGNTQYWCAPKPSYDELYPQIASGSLVRCSLFTTYVPLYSSYNYNLPLCDPEPFSTCGYDVSHIFANNVFSDAIIIDDIEIGDVLSFKMTGGISSNLDDFECYGVANGVGYYEGVQKFKVLNPSVQLQ